VSRFVVSDEARADIRSMSNYVAERDPEAAERLALDIRESFRLLAERPLIGHTRPDLLRAPVRV
jgi:plasmid stabilization system protein ParE